MPTTFLVLTQTRPSSDAGDPYKALAGDLYHFPKVLSDTVRPKARFVYFEPNPKGGIYFGRGTIGRVIEDPDIPDRLVAQIENYVPFGDLVPIRDPATKERFESDPERKGRVRTLSEPAFERICLLGGARMSFVSDAHLMRVLGEHLISSEKVGILELVKNAYDANADSCVVRVEGIPGLAAGDSGLRFADLEGQGPVIAVWDDGTGMDETTIRNAWARPATIDKTMVKEELWRAYEKAGRKSASKEFEAVVRKLKKKRGGRLPLGEKGVGRFASHRLGRYLWLRTKTKHSPLELELRIDWNEFDTVSERPRDLEAVYFSVKSQAPTWDGYSRDGSGTVLVIYGGRESYPWDKAKLKEIDSAIAAFKSPTKAPPDFKIDFECPQLAPEEKLLNPADWESPFELTALVDEDGTADGEIVFIPPSVLTTPLLRREWKIAEENIWDEENPSASDGRLRGGPERRAPECGSFYLRVRLWVRQREWMTQADYKNVVQYLQTRGGVAIYRDGLGVIPSTVIAERDWLGLSVRGRKKASKITYYNMLGEVELFQTSNLPLIDTTNRENLLETTPFRDLSRLVKALIVRLENVFLQVRDEYESLTSGPLPDKATLRKDASAVSSLLSRMAETYDLGGDPSGLFKGLREPPTADALKGIGARLKVLPAWIDRKEDEEEGLIETSGFAISISVSLHEITKLASALYHRASGLSSHFKRRTKLRNEADEVTTLAKSLLDEMRRLEPLRITRIEPPAVFELEDAVQSAFGVFSVRCREMRIRPQLPKPSNRFNIYGRYGVVAQVFANLFDNAVYWMSRTSSSEAGHRLVVEVDRERRRVIVADSGPGIDEVIRQNLFKPFYSLRVPPSGLGLFIAKHYMAQMKGSIRLADKSERLKDLSGAQFVLDFGRTPSISEAK